MLRRVVWLMFSGVSWVLIASIIRTMVLITLIMEAASIFKKSVNFYQITRRYIPEDSHLHIHRRENLKSHLVFHNIFL
jgi:hypothetical protein